MILIKQNFYLNNMKNITIAIAFLLVGCNHKQQSVNIETTPVYFQAYDENWYSDPSINPIFDKEWEAREYAKRNSMSQGSFAYSGHDYIVRVINHRYEVRRVNDEDDDILYTSNDFNDAYEYVVEFSGAHSDMIIYDLKTGKGYEETP
jgi:hypothetical protein